MNYILKIELILDPEAVMQSAHQIEIAYCSLGSLES